MITINIDYSFDKQYIKLRRIITRYIKSIFPDKYSFKYKNQKHDLCDIIDAIVFILKNDTSYTRLIINGIPGKTLNTHFNFFANNNVFDKIYVLLLKKHLKKNRCNKLKFQSIDSSYFYNVQCSENLKRNTYYKGKRGLKLSAIIDSTGMPLSLLLKDGNEHDSTFVEDNLNHLMIDPNTINYIKINKHKQYLLADTGYDSKEIRKLVSRKGYTYKCPQNRRNIQDENKIIKFSEKDKILYKKRIKVENFFAWIKKNKRIQLIKEKYVNTFMMFIYVTCILIIHKNITTPKRA